MRVFTEILIKKNFINILRNSRSEIASVWHLRADSQCPSPVFSQVLLSHSSLRLNFLCKNMKISQQREKIINLINLPSQSPWITEMSPRLPELPIWFGLFRLLRCSRRPRLRLLSWSNGIGNWHKYLSIKANLGTIKKFYSTSSRSQYNQAPMKGDKRFFWFPKEIAIRWGNDTLHWNLIKKKASLLLNLRDFNFLMRFFSFHELRYLRPRICQNYI